MIKLMLHTFPSFISGYNKQSTPHHSSSCPRGKKTSGEVCTVTSICFIGHVQTNPKSILRKVMIGNVVLLSQTNKVILTFSNPLNFIEVYKDMK